MLQGRRRKKAKAKTMIEKEMKEAFMRVMGRHLLVRRQTKEKQRRIRIASRTENHMERLEEILICKKRSMSGPRFQGKKKEQTRIARGKETNATICRQN